MLRDIGLYAEKHSKFCLYWYTSVSLQSEKPIVHKPLVGPIRRKWWKNELEFEQMKSFYGDRV